MLGCILGVAAGAIVFGAIKRHHYRRFAYGAYGLGGGCGGWVGPGYGFRGHHHFRRRSRGLGFGLLRDLFERLDTTPGQEKAIVNTISEARERFRGIRFDGHGFRRDVAAIFGSEVFDRGELEALIARRKEVLDQLTNDFVQTVAQLHEVLDPRQRRELSELLADGTLGMPFRPRYAW